MTYRRTLTWLVILQILLCNLAMIQPAGAETEGPVTHTGAALQSQLPSAMPGETQQMLDLTAELSQQVGNLVIPKGASVTAAQSESSCIPPRNVEECRLTTFESDQAHETEQSTSAENFLSELAPVMFTTSLSIPSIAPSSQSPHQSVVRYSDGAEVIKDQHGSLCLANGEILIAGTADMTVKSANCTIKIARGAVVLIERLGTILKIRNLLDRQKDSVRLVADDKSVTVGVGCEVAIGIDERELKQAQSADRIGRRKVTSFKLGDQQFLVRSDVSIISLMLSSKLLSMIVRSESKQDRVLSGKLIKMAAVLAQTTISRGAYSSH